MSDPVLDALVAWGEATAEVRAMILTSSRAVPNGAVDEFSDYDVIVAVTDPERFAHGDLDWQADAYGRQLVRWGDGKVLLGMPTWFRGVVYEDHVKIDFTIWPEALLEAVAAAERLPPGLDHGHRVLLDPEGRTRGWPSRTFTGHLLGPPTEDEYRAEVEEFWWDMSYVPKALARGELFFVNSFASSTTSSTSACGACWSGASPSTAGGGSLPARTVDAWRSTWTPGPGRSWPRRTPLWTPMPCGTPSSGWPSSTDESLPRWPRRSDTSTRRRSTIG